MAFISDEARAKISAAITTAETRTRGEIVAVVAHESATYLSVPFMIAALVALLAPWPLIQFTWMKVQTIYLLQLVSFLVLVGLLLPRPIRFRLVPRSILTSRAHRRAVEQFLSHNLSNALGRTGVLIYLSVAERYAEIIADAGLHGTVPQDEWRKIVDALTSRIAGGEPDLALITAIEDVGAILARHAPPDGTPSRRLPDHLIVLD